MTRSVNDPEDAAQPEAQPPDPLEIPHVTTATPPVSLVETAFLASTASLLWMVSYYLSVGPWMRK